MRILKEVVLGDLTLREWRYEPGYRMAAHRHEIRQWSVVLSGEVEETTSGQVRRAGAGSFFTRPPGSAHEVVFGSGGAKMLNLEIPAGFAESLEACGDSGFGESGPVFRLWLQVYHSFCSADQAALEDDIAELFSGMPGSAGAPIQDRELLRQACTRIHERHGDHVSLGQLAAELRVHRVYLARVFRSTLGCSMTEYLRQIRVQSATRLLASSCLPLAEVAQAAGFADQSHLTRIFKQVTGLTPRAFRLLSR